MDSQFKLYHGGTFQMPLDKPMRIDAADGELAILSGRVWLTRSNDPADHVLRVGERVRIEPRQHVVVEPWERSEWPSIRWEADADRAPVHPPGRGLRAAVLAPVLRGLAAVAEGVAAGLRGAETGFAALARSAASRARRAQGCI